MATKFNWCYSTNNTNYPNHIQWNGVPVTYTKEPVEEVYPTPDFENGEEALKWMEDRL